MRIRLADIRRSFFCTAARESVSEPSWNAPKYARSARGTPTYANGGSVGVNGGTSAAKAASECSNADTDSTAVATMAEDGMHR
jgi:hypothetical protein